MDVVMERCLIALADNDFIHSTHGLSVDQSEIVSGIVCSDADAQSRKAALEWLSTKHHCEAELIVCCHCVLLMLQMNQREAYAALITAVQTLPLPVAEEIVPHLLTSQWRANSHKRSKRANKQPKRQRK
jgi:hypothetical protein